MIKGTVTWWNVDRGWGFASTADHGDVFIHHAALEADGDDLLRGEVVQLNPVPGTVGTVAANVVRAA
jgi:cold shock protein